MNLFCRSIFIVIPFCLPALVLGFEPPVEVVEPIESSPVNIGILEFSTVTQKQWKPFHCSGNKWNPDWVRRDEVIVQLRVANRGDSAVLFPTFDRIRAILKGADGKRIPLACSRDATCISPSILLKPGQGYSYSFIARLVEGHESDKIELMFSDLTGGGSSTIMTPGVYTLWFDLQPNGDRYAKKGDLDVQVWTGKGSTEPVSFELITSQSRQ